MSLDVIFLKIKTREPLMKRISIILLLTSLAFTNTSAHSHAGDAVIGGLAGGMASGVVSGLITGSMIKSSSGSSTSSEVVTTSSKGYYRDIDKLESSVRYDLLKLDDKINNVSRDVSNVKEKIGADRDIQDLSTVKKDIKSVKSLVQNNESKVDTLEEKIDALDKKVSKLEIKITRDKKELESRIEKLESLVESKASENKSKETSTTPESNDNDSSSTTIETKTAKVPKVSPKFQIKETSPEAPIKSL